jgi:hypothetical protein
MKKSMLIGVLAIIIVVSGLVAAVVYYNLGFRQRADILPVARIKVYTNEAQTDEVEQGENLDWGEVHSGTNTKELWINNTGGVYALLAFNYNPQQLPGDWTETWDYNDISLAPKELRKVTITLTLPENIGAGHYEWDSGITAWEGSPP